MPKTQTTLNEWPVMECPAYGKTFTTDDNEALDAMNPTLHCENKECEAELRILHVEHAITVTLGVKDATAVEASNVE